MKEKFGEYLRNRRESLRLSDRGYSLRNVAKRIKVEPSYLSKVERGEQPPPSEAKILALAEALGEDPDALLARADKVAGDLIRIILRRPEITALALRELDKLAEHAALRLLRDLRDGRW